LRKFRLCLCTIAALSIAAPGSRPQTRHTPSLTEGLSLKVINGHEISPDGKFIAYRIRETDWKDNDYIRQIWLVNVASGESIQLTRGKKSAGDMEWSPDGRWLAFVTERETSAILPEEKKTDEKKPAEKKDDEKKDGDKKDDKKKEDDSSEKPAANQIWLISPSGGEAWQLTRHPTDIGGFHWSKDSRLIAFTSSAAESKAEKGPQGKILRLRSL